MDTLTVIGLMDGKPGVLRWVEGQAFGDAEPLSRLRTIVDMHEGEPFEAHPEGGGAPCGLDTYDSAYVTMPRVFDWVHEVIGPDPFAGVDTSDDVEREYGGRWTPSAHPRWPKGTPKGGKFMTKGEIAAAKKAGGPAPSGSPSRTGGRYKISVSAGQRGKNRFAVLDTEDRQGGKGAKRVSFHPTEAAARAEAKRLNQTTNAIPIPKDPDSKGAITTGDPREAAALLAQGKAVNLKQPRHVAVLLDELAKIVKDAEARGEKAPNYDLCKVTVRNTSLFCVESKGIPRIQMPQLKGIPVPGSVADRMEKDKRGEVDLTPGFLDHLQRGGFTMTDTEEHAAYLRPSQNELNGAKVAGIAKRFRAGKRGDKIERIIVSEDNYIVDGHHRWAAEVALDTEDNRLGNDKAMPITRVDISIVKLLREAILYANANGIPNAGFLTTNPANK